MSERGFSGIYQHDNGSRLRVYFETEENGGFADDEGLTVEIERDGAWIDALGTDEGAIDFIAVELMDRFEATCAKLTDCVRW